MRKMAAGWRLDDVTKIGGCPSLLKMLIAGKISGALLQGEREATMKMIDVKMKAKAMGIKPKKYKKADLIRKIQIEEGNHPCFQINGDICDQEECCWRKDCLT